MDETPRLDFSRVSLNMMTGRQTQLTLDTNVVISMIDCCKTDAAADDSTLKKNGLLEFVNFLRDCNRLNLAYCISPYFALIEMPADQAEVAAQAVEIFPVKFGLTWTDAENSLAPDLSKVGRRTKTDRYLGLRDDESVFMSQYYGGLLMLLLVARDFRESEPFDQFKAFLRLSRAHLDIVSSRIIQIARFVLAPAQVEGTELHELWKDIVLNFTQREKPLQRYPSSFHQMDKAAMNGAHDLVVLDSALVVESRGLGGVDADPWLVTGDRKLASLVRAIHHVGRDRSEAGKRLERDILAHHGDYWTKTEIEIAVQQPRMSGKLDLDCLKRQALAIRALAERNTRISLDLLDSAVPGTRRSL
ncbi:hypothetical protein [Lysobacter firmicutimachus]|uniref:PIN domain-containing protein n=1 Tax=Lysobacter firmicutimachus TaxID=1792846 RepID=A0ABU8D0B5_9GAMM